MAHIEQLMDGCKNTLIEEGIYQWDEKYPSRQTFQDGILQDQVFVLMEGEGILAIVILNEKQNAGWERIPWAHQKGKTLAVHSLAVKPECQGRGYGKKILEFCEEYAKENEYGNIRLDVFSENRRANELYRKQGYTKAGEIEYSFKPEGHRLYSCYEKKI